MVQQALAIVPNSMPQPDLLLLRYRADLYRHQHNEPDDVFLVVEVAESSCSVSVAQILGLGER